MPCLVHQTPSLQSSSKQAQLTIGIANLAERPTWNGVRLAVDKINQLNGGKGFEVGYVRENFVKFRVVAVATGIAKCAGDSPEADTRNITKWLLMNSSYGIDFLVGGDSTISEGQKQVVEESSRIYLAQVGPDSFYENPQGEPVSNKYLFGVHLSSYKYSFDSIRNVAYMGGKKIAIAGRAVSAFFRTTCESAEAYAVEELGMELAMPRVNYTTEQVGDEAYQKQLASDLCNSDADLLLGCVNTDESEIWERTWVEMGCRPKAVWLTCVAWGCLSAEKDHAYMMTGTQWSSELSYGDSFFANGQAIKEVIEELYGVGQANSNTVGAYTSAYMLHKVIQASLRNADISDIQQELLFDFTIGGGDNYENIRRTLETLILPETVFGPVQMNKYRRNEGRLPVSLQALPQRGFILETFSPDQAASALIVYPTPLSQSCAADEFLDWNMPDTCWLCDHCAVCPEGFQPGDEGLSCVESPPRDASTSEQRWFWSFGCLFCTFSLGFSLFLVHQFKWNPGLKTDIMQSYLAILVPDLILALVYFPFFFTNLLRGDAIGETGCTVVGFLTFGATIATFCGPVIVAYCTYRKFNGVIEQKVIGGRATSSIQLTVFLIIPWLLGFALAGAVYSQGLLGSFRGLYCYTNDWTSLLTGGLTIILLFISCIVTMALFTRTYFMVQKSMTKIDSKKKRKGIRALLRNGLMLVSVLLLFWFTSAISGLFALAGADVPIWVESMGAILPYLQPICSTVIIMSDKSVWKPFLLKAIPKVIVEESRTTMENSRAQSRLLIKKKSAVAPAPEEKYKNSAQNDKGNGDE